ncbi:MAG: amidophosphoribosyltransferase [Ruminococcaceae bacterium]|nr:amidophosphoribosyltransferase [Oscillospiraceae bacterium]
MSGFFGVASKENCINDLFFGTDYHSHLGTKRGGMAVYGPNGLEKEIHNIENSPFRTKFEKDVLQMNGHMGIGCISDYEPQPLILHSHLGSFAISTIGKINNLDELVEAALRDNKTQFFAMSGGRINPTELVAFLIAQKDSIVEGIRYVQEIVDGSLSLLLLNSEGIYAARDRYGRTPVAVGRKDDAFCVCFESFSYLNLGYSDYKELGPSEVVLITPESCETLIEPGKDMRICSFLWVYYGYPSSAYEGLNVEQMRYNCGALMASRDNIKADTVAGVPDSGTAHAIGYANASGVPFTRPFIKYTPTWPRSFMPQNQSQRNLIAHMKLIAVDALLRDKSIILIDDSIVRGTQLRETAEFLYSSGVKEVHVRPACPPILFSCPYLNFSRSRSESELITRRVIERLEGGAVSDEVLQEYADPDSRRYQAMQEEIRKELKFTTLKYNRLDDMEKATGMDRCKLCTHCMCGRDRS